MSFGPVLRSRQGLMSFPGSVTKVSSSEEERVDYERYVSAIHLIGILERKAERVLSSNGQAPHR